MIEETSEQAEVFEKLKINDMIDKVICGFNSTIFAYGQTGSGKTFTLEGYSYDSKLKAVAPEEERVGVIPRLISSLFEKLAAADKSIEYTVYVSFLQLYKESIYDLLSPMQKYGGLKMRWNKNDEFYVENLYSYPCFNTEEVMAHYHKGLSNKIMSSHNLNANSSRSHCIFCLTIEALDKSGRVLHSKFQIVDLAGSEKTSLTGNEGLKLKESIEINKALFALRQVITNLSSGDSHIPYRDSKLTSLLKQSIGGNSYCLMIACISPVDGYIDENISTLEYATKAGFISNEPIKNVDPKTRVIKELKREVKRLKREMATADKHITLLTEIATMDKQEQLVRLKEMENMPLRAGHIQRIKALRSTIEDSKARTGYSQRFSVSPNNYAESSKVAESMQIIRDLRIENAALKQTLSKKDYNSNINSNEFSELYSENRKLHDRIEILERKIRKLEGAKASIVDIYSDKAYIEPKRIQLPSGKIKIRQRKTPAKSREDYWMYSEKKVSVTQPGPEYIQVAQPTRPITSEDFPQSKEDAIKALSQLLLNRAKVKGQTMTNYP